MPDTYRAAVIGLTGIGAGLPPAAPDPVLGTVMPHSHVSAYAAVPRVELAAVCDISPDMLVRFRDQWGSRLPETKTYADYHEMLANERIDLLSVVTSDHRHAQMVVDGVEAGVKGVFCEKPISTTLADAQRMIEACAARGVPLTIDHTMRWWPEYVEARRLIRSGAIGAVRRVMVTGGGPRAMLFRNTTHVVDMLCYLVDDDPAWLTAELDDGYADYPPRYAGDGGKDPKSDPGCSAYIHFRNGVRAHLSCPQMPWGYREWDVLGDEGRLRIGYQAAELWQHLSDGRTLMTPVRWPQTTRGDMVAAIEELIGLIERGGRGVSSGEDARRTLSILLGILQSNAVGGQRITFPVADA